MSQCFLYYSTCLKFNLNIVNVATFWRFYLTKGNPTSQIYFITAISPFFLTGTCFWLLRSFLVSFQTYYTFTWQDCKWAEDSWVLILSVLTTIGFCSHNFVVHLPTSSFTAQNFETAWDHLSSFLWIPGIAMTSHNNDVMFFFHDVA